MNQNNLRGVTIITGETGTWYPVHETDATRHLDAELDEKYKELARPHLAANLDYLDSRYGTLETPTRLQRVINMIRRIA